MTEPRTTVTSYEVTIWPEDCSGMDSATYCCSVVYAGFGNWTVRRGSASSDAPVLGSDGEWHHERRRPAGPGRNWRSTGSILRPR